MDNQHRLIKGYRELSQQEIDAMNEVKEIEQIVLKMIDELTKYAPAASEGEVRADPRWLAIAKTDLQKGFMALGRAIARPDGY